MRPNSHSKAFLAAKGLTEEGLKSLRHDIEEALETAEAKGLSSCVQLSKVDRAVLSSLNAYYAEKWLEYPEAGGLYRLPCLSDVAPTGQRLLGAVGPVAEADSSRRAQERLRRRGATP